MEMIEKHATISNNNNTEADEKLPASEQSQNEMKNSKFIRRFITIIMYFQCAFTGKIYKWKKKTTTTKNSLW